MLFRSEAVLGGVLGVAEVGCCGVPDADLVEVVAAAVVPDGTVSEAELLRRLETAAGALSGLKRPRQWTFVTVLPRNALGKLMRARIAKEAFGR